MATKHVQFHVPDTKDVTLDQSDDGATILRVPVTSTSQDRDGDRLTENGINAVAAQLESGETPLYLDHGLSAETGFREYRVADMIGGWVGAEVDNGQVYGLARLEPGNEDAEMLASKVDAGLPVGFSIGFIPDYNTATERDNGGLNFNDLDLLETSAVGIPSNPDAVTAGVAMARAFEEHGVSPDSLDADNVAQLVKSMTEDTKEPEGTEESTEVAEADTAPDTTDAADAETDATEAEGTDIIDEVREVVQNELAEHRESLLAEVRTFIENETDATEPQDVETDAADGTTVSEKDTEDAQLVIDGYDSLEELKAEIVEEVKAASLGTPQEAEEPKGIATTQTPAAEAETNGRADSATRKWLME